MGVAQKYCSCAGAFMAAAAMLAVSSMAGCQAVNPSREQADTSASAEDPLLREIFNKVVAHHVTRPAPVSIAGMSVEEIMATLDPHSRYHPPEEYAQVLEGSRGEYGGLGMQVEAAAGQIGVRVVAPMDDSPAASAGLLTGDIITHVNDVPLAGKDIQIAIGLMRGEPGSTVNLTILRGTEPAFTVRVARSLIAEQTVNASVIEDTIGYIRISSFNGRTHAQFEDALRDIRRHMGNNALGYIIDLRNNPGGTLNQAIRIADELLERGTIVSVGTGSSGDRVYRAGGGDMTRGAPLVILTNGGSASASEVLTGALQDNGRAIVLGRTTYGKGSVQRFFPLQAGGALRLTTDHYFTPSGDSVQGRGIVPDVLFIPAQQAQSEPQGEQAWENALANPLNLQDTRQPEASCAAMPEANPEILPPALRTDDGTGDYQLACAVDHLRAIPAYTVTTPLSAATPVSPSAP